ncbi:unnamed protein product [Haemonchus placei]|uniref:RRM domain-containing protein n=1 Tax=Haemonchus placei TaxID=6290 RepID=A0A0N4XA90_HAEPC|nr:unnamed protein product [Haemonchus placei]
MMLLCCKAKVLMQGGSVAIDRVDAAIAARPHVIDGKTVNPERAMPTDKDRDTPYVSTKRLYVSGVREDHTEQMFTEYFIMYGNVVKAQKPRDRVYLMGRSRGDAPGGWPGDWGEQVTVDLEEVVMDNKVMMDMDSDKDGASKPEYGLVSRVVTSNGQALKVAADTGLLIAGLSVSVLWVSHPVFDLLLVVLILTFCVICSCSGT